MRSILLLFFCGLMASGLWAQAPDLSAMENDMKASFGQDRVVKLIQLSDAYLQTGNTSKALDWAEEAEQFSKRISANELRAMSLNREAKAYRAAGKTRKANAAYVQSNDILHSNGIGNKSLLLENLQSLRALALENGKTDEAQKIDQKIVEVNQGVRTPTPPDAPLTRAEMREEIAALRQEVSSIHTSNRPKNMSDSEWNQKNKAFEAQIAAQEATIQQMNEEQAKNQLLLMQQRSLLDSMHYKAGLDSLVLSNSQLELQQANSARQFNYAVITLLLLLAGGSTFSFVRAKQNATILTEKNKIIVAEQERSENLLLNILPALVAKELKQNGYTKARYFEDVSVLFADFVGFSQIAEQLRPQELITELDTCFKEFDDIITRHGLEKIKTIGDAYMCAGGLPDGGGSKIRDMVEAAREMQIWLNQWNASRSAQNQPRFDARIGIHCGPVVAGVVGSRKFAFDIWGDTVNVASRIEAAGEGGKINISGTAYQKIKSLVPCTYRGKIAAKNKGEIDMYYVEN